MESGIQSLSPQEINIIVAVSIAVGTLYCFLGYRALKFIIGLTGFLLAGAAAGALAVVIMRLFNRSEVLSNVDLLVIVGAGGLGGIMGACTLFFLYKAGVFCLGALGAALTAHNVLAGSAAPWVLWAVIGAGVLGGLVALLLERPVMTLATSAIGAWVVVSGIAYSVLGPGVLQIPPGPLDAIQTPFGLFDARQIMLAAWAVLGLAGLMTQFATHKGRGKDAAK